MNRKCTISTHTQFHCCFYLARSQTKVGAFVRVFCDVTTRLHEQPAVFCKHITCSPSHLHLHIHIASKFTCHRDQIEFFEGLEFIRHHTNSVSRNTFQTLRSCFISCCLGTQNISFQHLFFFVRCKCSLHFDLQTIQSY